MSHSVKIYDTCIGLHPVRSRLPSRCVGDGSLGWL